MASEVPDTIYHLAAKADWEAAATKECGYFTESLEKVRAFFLLELDVSEIRTDLQ